MTTPTCTVCGATEVPGRDHTCPVCGADLPDLTEATSSTVEPEPSPEEAAGAADADAPEPDAPGPEVEPEAPRTEAPPPPPAWPTTATPPTSPPPTSPPPTSPPPGGAGPPARPTPSPYDPSHPSGLSSSVRTYGMLTHLSAFLGALVALAFIGPLVMWLIRRDEHPFLDHHGKEALNFNLSMLLYLVVGFVASIATLGLGLVVVIPAAAVFFVTWIVTTIIGAVKANAGEGYRYPLTIRFVQD